MFRLLLIAAILIVNTISTTCHADDNKNDEDDDILSTNLSKWLRDNGAYINDKLVVKNDGSYRGVFATQDMEVGERVCSIPSHLIIQPTAELMNEEDVVVMSIFLSFTAIGMTLIDLLGFPETSLAYKVLISGIVSIGITYVVFIRFLRK